MYRYNGHGIVSRPVVFYRLTKRRNSRLAPRLLRQSFLFRTREWPRTLRVLSRTYDFSSDVPDAYRENLEELKQTDGGSAKNETVPPPLGTVGPRVKHSILRRNTNLQICERVDEHDDFFRKTIANSHPDLYVPGFHTIPSLCPCPGHRNR